MVFIHPIGICPLLEMLLSPFFTSSILIQKYRVFFVAFIKNPIDFICISFKSVTLVISDHEIGSLSSYPASIHSTTKGSPIFNFFIFDLVDLLIVYPDKKPRREKSRRGSEGRGVRKGKAYPLTPVPSPWKLFALLFLFPFMPFVSLNLVVGILAQS